MEGRSCEFEGGVRDSDIRVHRFWKVRKIISNSPNSWKVMEGQGKSGVLKKDILEVREKSGKMIFGTLKIFLC